ncbi:hypothetical protein [Nostoc sp.]|uniref:hypothetical protein n=1 Tax=Nostoc sp. TaxID=1180 RepID=UPI002FF986C4
MENRLEGQDIQGDELFIELTPEELKELEQLKGGLSFADSKIIFHPPLINGIPFPFGVVKLTELGANPANISIQGTKDLGANPANISIQGT